MKIIRLISLILVFLNINLYANDTNPVFEEEFQNKNIKLLNPLFKAIIKANSLDKFLTDYDDYDDFTSATEGKYVYTSRHYKQDYHEYPYNIWLFRINRMLRDDYSLKWKDGTEFKFTKGAYILFIIPEGRKKPSRILIGHESELGVETCLAPYKSGDIKFTSTCEQKWDRYFYEQVGSLTLHSYFNQISPKLSDIDKDHEYVKNTLMITNFILDFTKKSAKSVKKYIVKHTMQKTLNAPSKDNKYLKDVTATSLTDFMFEAGKAKLITSVSSLFSLTKKLGILNDLMGYIRTLEVQSDMCDINVAKEYLQKYYYYGGMENWVAKDVTGNVKTSMNDILREIAKDINCLRIRPTSSLSTFQFHKSGVDYSTEYSEKIISNIQKVIDSYTREALVLPKVQNYTKFKMIIKD